MILSGTFTSAWDGDTEITTVATLDTETGEVDAECASGDLDVYILEKEYFTDKAGNTYPVCPECHYFILKTVMKEGVGKTLYEALVCSNPDCDNK
jgi:hypothetical protein